MVHSPLDFTGELARCDSTEMLDFTGDGLTELMPPGLYRDPGLDYTG